jgi:hypothetical protein
MASRVFVCEHCSFPVKLHVLLWHTLFYITNIPFSFFIQFLFVFYVWINRSSYLAYIFLSQSSLHYSYGTILSPSQCFNNMWPSDLLLLLTLRMGSYFWPSFWPGLWPSRRLVSTFYRWARVPSRSRVAPLCCRCRMVTHQWGASEQFVPTNHNVG